VRPILQRTLGRDVQLVTSGSAVARRAERALAARDMLNDQEREGDYRFLCTGDVAAFREAGTRFLQMPLGDVQHVELGAVAA
jgi:glutamate racemase